MNKSFLLHDTATIPSHFNCTWGCGLPRTAACVKHHIVKTWSMLMLMQNTRVRVKKKKKKRSPVKRSLTQQHKFGGRHDCKHQTVKPCLPLGRETINAPVVSGPILYATTNGNLNAWAWQPDQTLLPFLLQASGVQFNVCSHRLETHTASHSARKPQRTPLLGPALMRQA